MQPSVQTSSGLTDQQRSRVDALLDELLDLPEDTRASHMSDRIDEDPMVLAEVDSLMRAAQASASFLSAPARPAVDDVVPDAAIGTRLGAWTITRLIGRGGMGDVYEGVRTQGDFQQRVAIKLLQRDAGAQLERFEAERQILARLEHPGIARLYDGGVTSDGRPFMVMEFVEGRAITDFCVLTHASFEQRLRLFSQVCDAVAYAHRNLIVHRDLKPSNIMVTAAGVVKLLDFGIAKLLDPQLARMTQVAVAPMTPICAAPEQLAGDPITTATDVYALGLLLFELLTGTHAWLGSETPMLLALRTVLQRPAPSASRTAEARAEAPVPARLIRGDLDAIVAKALRTEPAYRYATVDSLKSDVGRVLDGEPVAAREGARLYLLGHLLRRYRW
ncbi:MAG TPA: serine/threonine-protein kinase, partial [Steroidobacteraceae bacterium]